MSEPAWLSEKMGLVSVASINADAFYTVFRLLLRAAYQEGRLSVLEEAFKSAASTAGPDDGQSGGTK